VREDARQRATEFVKELYAAGAIDANRLDTSVDEVLAARSEVELARVIRSLPAPVTLTSQERQLARPLEIHSGVGRLRLDPPVPGLPLVRLDVTTNIGRVRLHHPGNHDRPRRWPGSRRHR
jgi:hypothetical protein